MISSGGYPVKDQCVRQETGKAARSGAINTLRASSSCNFCSDLIGVLDPNTPGFVCQRIRLSGVVQGVGLRPLALRLAKELKLTGWVRNDAHGVEIEVCGKPESVERLIEILKQVQPCAPRLGAMPDQP